MNRKSLFLALSVLTLLVGHTSQAAWTAASLNGYAYHVDGQNIATPLPDGNGGTTWFIVWQGTDGSVTTLNQGQYFYFTPGSIYDHTAQGWVRRPTCSLGDAKKFYYDAVTVHQTNATTYYAAYYYAKRAEALAYFNACKGYIN